MGEDAAPPSWVALAQLLPAAREEKADRKALFDRFDPNGNGYLSLAEVDKGLIDQFQLDGGSAFATKRCKPAIIRAFQAAKDINGSTEDLNADMVTRSEFRLLLVYLQRYFELLAVFDEVDSGDDRRIDAAEFAKAVPKLRGWGVIVRNPVAEFKKVDANGGGQVLFDEFAAWALRRGLDMLDDEPEEGEESLIDQHKAAASEASKAAAALARGAEARAAASEEAKKDVEAGGVPKWVAMAQLLPAAREEKADRKALFDRFDPNGNGYLSLAEVDKGLIDQFQLDGGSAFATKRCKPAIIRAFQAAKDINGSTEDLNADMVTRSEFRLLLVYLQRYFELLAVFDEVDSGDDRRIDAAEFAKAVPKLRGWGVIVRNPVAEFKKVDANGGGQVLFDEFAAWALRRGLDMLDDEPEEGEESMIDQHKAAASEASKAAAALAQKASATEVQVAVGGEVDASAGAAAGAPAGAAAGAAVAASKAAVEEQAATVQLAPPRQLAAAPANVEPPVTTRLSPQATEPPPTKPARRVLPKAGLRFASVTIEPVPPQPQTPFQQYLEAQRRFQQAVKQAGA